MSVACRIRLPVLAGVAALSLLTNVPALRAQEPEQAREPELVIVTGRVLDAVSGEPIPTAVVYLGGTDRSVMADGSGHFAIPNVPVGSWTFFIEQLGYADLTLTEPVGPEGVAIVAELDPQPVVLEGLSVMADRFEARRQSTGRPVQVLRPADFLAQPPDLFRAVRSRAGLQIVSCTARHEVRSWCVLARGEYAPPSVWVDDQPVYTLEDLGLFQTSDVYAVEVYGRGRAIRVYTRDYIRRVAAEPRALPPIRTGYWW